MKHNRIFERVVENTERKSERLGKQVFAVLNIDRNFEYLTKTEINRKKKKLLMQPDCKLRVVTFYKTHDKIEKYYTEEEVDEYRTKFLSYAKYLKNKKKE